METLNLAIKAAFSSKLEKIRYISQLKIVVEILKNLVRIVYELDILKADFYINIQTDLQEISKMANGWLKYAQQKEA